MKNPNQNTTPKKTPAEAHRAILGYLFEQSSVPEELNTEELNKNANDILRDAIDSYLSGNIPEPEKDETDNLEKKTPGIALTHHMQGYSANKRPDSLLTKKKFLTMTKSLKAYKTPDFVGEHSEDGIDPEALERARAKAAELKQGE